MWGSKMKYIEARQGGAIKISRISHSYDMGTALETEPQDTIEVYVEDELGHHASYYEPVDTVLGRALAGLIK